MYLNKPQVSASNTVSALTWIRESLNSWKSCFFPLENASAMISPVRRLTSSCVFSVCRFFFPEYYFRA